VLLMAAGNLTSIAAYLLDNGRPPGTPVACIQHAATPRHQVIRCSLAEVAAAGTDRKVENPAVIVIGPTVPVLLCNNRDNPSQSLGTSQRFDRGSPQPPGVHSGQAIP
jgi:siroheme synthase